MSGISRLATAAVVSGAVAVTGLTTGAAVAAADGPSYVGGNCPQGVTCTHWCPGDPAIPGSQVLSWDWNVCHDWYWNSDGIVDVDPSVIYPWSGVPHQVAAPPPAPLPPGTPFCSPRGALIIIPPICDEIGVDLPRGSVHN